MSADHPDTPTTPGTGNPINSPPAGGAPLDRDRVAGLIKTVLEQVVQVSQEDSLAWLLDPEKPVSECLTEWHFAALARHIADRIADPSPPPLNPPSAVERGRGMAREAAAAEAPPATRHRLDTERGAGDTHAACSCGAFIAYTQHQGDIDLRWDDHLAGVDAPEAAADQARKVDGAGFIS